MASFGAHLTSTGGEEGNVPSIFEVLAQENLVSTLRPALKYACKILAENHPERFAWLHQYSEETFSLLALLLESFYLKRYSSSFAENFYGLKRVTVDNHNKGRLSRKTRIKSLMFLVLLPFVKNRADSVYEDRDPEAISGTQQDWRSRLHRAFLSVYPSVHMLYQTAVFTCQLLYVFGKLGFHSPWLAAAGVRLRPLSVEDMQQQQGAHSLAWDWQQQSLLGNMRTVVGRGLGVAALLMSSGLSAGVFFLQFLEWWYSSEQHRTAITSLPVPPPPTQSKPHEDLPTLPSICPLCQRLRTNDTALAVTGYVFCYPCIYRYVTQHRRCPVTGYPASSDNLVKLYLTSS